MVFCRYTENRSEGSKNNKYNNYPGPGRTERVEQPPTYPQPLNKTFTALNFPLYNSSKLQTCGKQQKRQEHPGPEPVHLRKTNKTHKNKGNC